MHSYIDLYFAPENVSPLDLAERLRARAGLEFIIGSHDLAFDWETVDEFRRTLASVHEALKGTGVLYRVETVHDEPSFVEPMPWPPPIRDKGPVHHPAYDRRP
jgi:hypothetical protein